MKHPKLALQRIIILAVLSGLCIVPAKLIASPQQSVWFNGGSPVFALQNATMSESQLPTTISFHGNVDCNNLTFTTREGAIIPPLFYKESTFSSCFIDTTAGEVDGNGYISVPGTPYVAQTVHEDHTPYPFTALPGADVFISRQSGVPAIGNYVWLSRLKGSTRFTNSLTGTLWAEVTPVTQTPISDAAGNKLPVLLDNFAVSGDGSWAVVDSPGHGIIRINLETMEVLPFTDSLENNDGSGSAERIAITSDGRYVVVSSKAFHTFRMYDLSTCAAVPAVITQPVNCQSRELDTYFRSQVNDLGSILQMRFITNDQLKIYASYDISSNYKIGQFALAAPGTTLAGMEYLGMGDSFSSGEGSQNYEVGTDDPNNKCHLSKLAYPYIIAQKLNLNSFHSVACSGAVSYNVIGGSGYNKDSFVKDRENQYEKNPLVNSLGSWIPGYSKQVKFIAENQPRLITLSVIGNDLNFDTFVKNCVLPGTCYPSYEDRLEVFKNVDSKLEMLTNLYKKLKATGPVNARIYAVGYPQVALSTGTCGINVHLNESELTFANMLISRMDVLVKTAASKAGINYADIEDALNGHRLCEAGSGDIAMNGLTAGNDIKGLIGNESFHPNGYGQFLMAQKILQNTNSLGIVPPQTALNLPALSENNPAFSGLPKTGRSLNRLSAFTTNSPVISKGQNITATLNGLDHALQPNKTYSVAMNATPVTTVTSDGNGTISIVVPSVLPGLQTVHIIGPDVTNLPVDLSAIIAVTDPNNQFGCGLLPKSGQDIDQDGIDDACDPIIGPPPSTNPPAITPPTPPANSTAVAPVQPASLTSTHSDSAVPALASPITISASATTARAGSEESIQIDDSPPNDNSVPESNSRQLSASSSPVKKTGHVLGAVTAISSQHLREAISSTSLGLSSIATIHPIGFSFLLIILLVTLILLAAVRHSRYKNYSARSHIRRL